MVLTENSLDSEQAGESPEVTVCISAYNHEKYIRRAIESVVSQQTEFTFDVLIGEDLSTDSTPAICDQLASDCPGRIRVIHRSQEEKLFIDGKPVGRGNLLNTILESNGRYVALLDGDDFWATTDKLQRQWEFIQSHPEVCFSFSNCFRLVDGQGVAVSKRRPELEPFSFQDFPQAVCRGLPVGCVPSSFFFSRSVFNRGLEEMREHFLSCPFFDLLIPFAMSRFAKIAYHPEPTFCYLVRPGSVKGGGENRELFSVRCHEWIVKYLTTRDCDDESIKRLARRYSKKHSIAGQFHGFEKVVDLLKECDYLEYLPVSPVTRLKAGLKQTLQSSSWLLDSLVRHVPDIALSACFDIRKLVVK